MERQAGDLGEGRIYAGLGQLLPGGNVGDPERYEEFEARSETVEFTNREGSNLVGRFWPCDSAESPTNPQDGANFFNGTVDALRYALGRAAEFAIDGSHIGLVGHSLGASAVSNVQECSSSYPARMVADGDLPAACEGERFPIDAIVAYDSLSSGVTPVVPAFDHRADGYFINWVPTFTAPDPAARVTGTSAFATWKSAGVETVSITVRAGTLSVKWASGAFLTDAHGTPVADIGDLREYARTLAPGSVVAVGDWAGANTETEYGVAQPRGEVHGTLRPGS